MRASLVSERAGVPSVSIIAEGFRVQAKALEPMYGLAHAPIAFYPGVIMNDTEELLRERVAEFVVPAILEELGRPYELLEDDSAAGPETSVFSGSLDEVQEHFHAKGWSDGLAFVPPTLERVREFFRYTSRDPHEVIGVLPPADTVATPWTVAVNAVMAGCKPEYMPVLLAIVDAVASDEFRMQDAGASPGWEILVILSGPVADELGFNSGQGVMRPGNRANTSIGRFLRMYLRNIAGLRPGGADKGTFSMSWNCVLAEADAITQEIGWAPHRVQRGFGLADSTVTTVSVAGLSAPVLSTGDADSHLAQIGEVFRDNSRYFYARAGVLYGAYYPTLLMSPAVARVVAEKYSKAEVQRYMAAGIFGVDGQRLAFTAAEAERVMSDGLRRPIHIPDIVAQGVLPKAFHESDDPNRPIPLLPDPAALQFVVAGDPFRNQARIYVQNHKHGRPVTRLIEKPPSG